MTGGGAGMTGGGAVGPDPHRRRNTRDLPPLWLFTDPHRLPDPRPTVARLPRGLAGVILRHDNDPQRARLGRDLARICRARRLVLVVAGDARLAAALHAGLHLRNGRRAGCVRSRTKLLTSSAHGAADLVRARRTGAAVAFLSPVFATASHPEAHPLGPARWAALANRAGLPVAALGGLSGRTVRRLPRWCAGAGAIGALSLSSLAGGEGTTKSPLPPKSRGRGDYKESPLPQRA